MNYLINLINKEVSPHKHKLYEIIIYTKGYGILHAEGKNIETGPGFIVIIPPETVHYCSACDSVYERIYINGEFNQIFNLTSVTVIHDNEEKEGTLLAEMIHNNRYASSEYVAALINAFMHFLLRNIKMDNVVFLTVKKIVEKISNEFYNSDLHVGTLLKKSGYAEDYIRAQFKKIMGKTPTDFLTEIRIRHACYLIETCRNSLSLAEIAEKCGYTDYVYFSRKFKCIMGVSPRKYMMGT